MAYRKGGGASVARAGADDGAAPSIVPDLPRSRARAAAARLPHIPRCPELDCVRHLLHPGVAALAELRAAEIAVDTDRVLIAAQAMDEFTHVAALAAALGISVEQFATVSRQACPLADDELIDAFGTGILPLRCGSTLDFVLVPSLVGSRRLIEVVQAHPALRTRIRLATSAHLRAFVSRMTAEALAERAAAALPSTCPDLSARDCRPGRRALGTLAVAGFAGLWLALAAPFALLTAIETVLGLVFLAWTGLRLFGFFSERLVRRDARSLADDWLPVYSIVVALYREAKAVSGLVDALRAIDYPIEKLEIILVLEPDDRETRAAIEALRLGPPFQVIVAPGRGPRTKPKALNAALPFVRGTFLAVYDAEDRPEPNQLRLALEAFVAGDDRLACVQARLTIDNTADSWLARLFTAEYAGLFDVFLPGLSAWHLPLPLGGSSNHFRTATLRQLGAWDPYNVTEDADLGMRLARFGYRTAVIPSSTYEEAPASFRPWLKQRTRWFKGWMQTWLVHMRAPRALVRDLGLAGFAVFELLVGGTVLAALVHVLFAGHLAVELVAAAAGGEQAPALGFHLAVLLGGYLVSAVLGLVGLVRRRLLACAWALLLMPAYWLLLSVAAWRALIQLLRDPQRWEKTEHGLARTSRLAQAARGRAAACSGPPCVHDDRLRPALGLTDSGADRRRLPVAAA
jgi:cellulose synthase/poly-beta-1,6-N-acetylglucosamine synthase-like glycosyltransferase